MADHAVTSIPVSSGTKTHRIYGALPRFVHLVFTASLLSLVVLATGFFLFLSEVDRLAKVPAVGKVDAIVVLTGGRARIETAVALLRDGKARRLLISGAHPESSRADIRRAVKASRQLFDCCVDIDNAALDTVGNAEQASDWSRKNGFASLIVVTSDYHMPRSMMELQRKLPGAMIVPHQAQGGNSALGSLLDDPQSLAVLVPEYLKYVAAALRLSLREKTARTALASTMAF